MDFSKRRPRGGQRSGVKFSAEALSERRKRNETDADSDERSSEEERKGNALASGADEGRDKLR